MTPLRVTGIVAIALGAAVFAQPMQREGKSLGQPIPLADHHQHLFSPELAALMSTTPPASSVATRTADDLIAQLDAAGIKRAVVLSTAYIFEQPSRHADAAADKLRRDNDWTSRQVARFPDRLIGFCGLNPLKDYALDELARCARDPNLRRGLKLHFGNSVVDYHNPAHIEQVRRVFRAANDYGMAIVVHMRASVTQKLPYGRDEATIFLNELVPAAPDVVRGSGLPTLLSHARWDAPTTSSSSATSWTSRSPVSKRPTGTPRSSSPHCSPMALHVS